jgi:hypothetical protein
MFSIPYIQTLGRNYSQVYAVYNRKKTLIYGLAGLRLLTTAATIVIEVFYMPAGENPHVDVLLSIIYSRPTGAALPPVHNLTGCFAPSVSRNLGAGFILSLANETLLCLFMLYKRWERYRNQFGSFQLELLVQDRSAKPLF